MSKRHRYTMLAIALLIGAALSNQTLFAQPTASSNAASSFPDEAVRTWQDASGKFTIQAVLIGAQKDSVSLKKEDGITIKVPLSKLRKADQEYIQSKLEELLSKSQSVADRLFAARMELMKSRLRTYKESEREISVSTPHGEMSVLIRIESQDPSRPKFYDKVFIPGKKGEMKIGGQSKGLGQEGSHGPYLLDIIVDDDNVFVVTSERGIKRLDKDTNGGGTILNDTNLTPVQSKIAGKVGNFYVVSGRKLRGFKNVINSVNPFMGTAAIKTFEGLVTYDKEANKWHRYDFDDTFKLYRGPLVQVVEKGAAQLQIAILQDDDSSKEVTRFSFSPEKGFVEIK